MAEQILEKLGSSKAILIFGPRQVGKTTLLKHLFQNRENVRWFFADDPDVRALFENATSSRLRAEFGSAKIIIVDEAQRIPDAGLKFKLITDQIPQVQLFATGSSALELTSQTSEPLTGRKWEFRLYPLSFQELVNHHGLLEEKRMLPNRLVYGSYPEVINNARNEKEILLQLSDSFLYKDLLILEGIKKPEKLVKLLQALAHQVGSEVSYNELARKVGMDNQTVEKYISLLEQSYVIFRLGALSRNLRKELSRGRKIYFNDNGIRNALIGQFGPIESRADKGALWENYLISERRKYLAYNKMYGNSYFWRTQDQQEIDYLEERDGKFFAWEFKFSPNAKVRFSKTFKDAYPAHILDSVNSKNYDEFLYNKNVKF